MSTYMLFNMPPWSGWKFLHDSEYEISKINFIYQKKHLLSIGALVQACEECIKETKENDTIVCAYDLMGVLCWWLCKLQHKKRNIIAINILLKTKKTLKNKILKILYRVALKSKNFHATVTSVEYGQWINGQLGISSRYTLLHDTYRGGYSEYTGIPVKRNSIFCGGRNGRDWKLLAQIAEKMPDTIFNLVMPQQCFEEYKSFFGKNVNAKFDIPEDEFAKLMLESELMVMPLNTEAPAGLIVLFHAAGSDKLVITTNTVTTREYFGNGKGVLCGNSIDEWIEQIKYWQNHSDKAKEYVNRCNEFLEDECSERKYAETLMQLIHEVNCGRN